MCVWICRRIVCKRSVFVTEVFILLLVIFLIVSAFNRFPDTKLQSLKRTAVMPSKCRSGLLRENVTPLREQSEKNKHFLFHRWKRQKKHRYVSLHMSHTFYPFFMLSLLSINFRLYVLVRIFLVCLPVCLSVSFQFLLLFLLKLQFKFELIIFHVWN